ncbi:MAG: hypothetical protein EOO75_17080, partial [Myxococcales bacterium]
MHGFVDGHLLETITLRDTRLAYDVALAWDDDLAPNLEYTAFERNAALSNVLAYVWSLAAAATLRADLGPELSREAFASWLAATRALGRPAAREKLPEPVAELAMWPCADGSLRSARAIEAYGRRTRALCTSRGARGAAPDGRPVLLLPQGQPLLELFPDLTVVEYDHVLRGGTQPAIDTDPEASLGFEREPLRITIQPGPSRLHVTHAGIRCLDAPRPSRYGDVTIVVDDPTAVPHPSGTGLVWSTPRRSYALQEGQLLRTLLDRAERAPDVRRALCP